jgi:trehalose 6-phosphate synthase/phosphatase
LYLRVETRTIRTLPIEVIERIRTAADLRLLLDYDGTLVPIAPTPELASPESVLLDLLGALAARAGTSVHLVSGRPAAVLDEWFGHLPLVLWAEHGAYHRPSPFDTWESTLPVHTEWMADVYPILEQITIETPGSLIEPKRASVAWHYRGADPETGPGQAHELRVRLRHVLRRHAVEVLEGRKVIEIRMAGVSKAIVARRMLAAGADLPEILAIGDDWTDEDLFNALPESSVTIAVGRRGSSADYQLADDREVRKLLEALVS